MRAVLLALLAGGCVVEPPDLAAFERLPLVDRPGTGEAVGAMALALGDDPDRISVHWVAEDFWAPSAGRRVAGASMELDGACLVWVSRPLEPVADGPLPHELTHCAMGAAGIPGGDPRNGSHLDSEWWGPAPAMEGVAREAARAIQSNETR